MVSFFFTHTHAKPIQLNEVKREQIKKRDCSLLLFVGVVVVEVRAAFFIYQTANINTNADNILSINLAAMTMTTASVSLVGIKDARPPLLFY